MKILRPVDAAIRKPDPEFGKIKSADMAPLVLSGTVVAVMTNKNIAPDYSALVFAFYDHSNKCWENASPGDLCLNDKNNQITTWYQEIEIESLFPDDDHSTFVAKAASNGSFSKILSHQEGQAFVQNHILKELKK